MHDISIMHPRSALRTSLTDKNFRKQNVEKVEDIFEGAKCVKLKQKFGEELFLTYNMNTDGGSGM